jgi:multidrug transporter EmrE-like cation transporter
MMLGGLLLPFAYGILFANEALSCAKALSILLICTAVGCSFEKGAGGKNAYRFYAAIFVLNGLVGVLSKIHLSVPALAVDSYSFMATIQLALLAMCLFYCLITRQGIPKQSGKLYLCLSGYAVCNGIGNLFCQIALTSLPASVQYPIITGGVMVFSTLISLVRREPIGGKTYLAAVLACLSTILILF